MAYFCKRKSPIEQLKAEQVELQVRRDTVEAKLVAARTALEDALNTRKQSFFDADLSDAAARRDRAVRDAKDAVDAFVDHRSPAC